MGHGGDVTQLVGVHRGLGRLPVAQPRVGLGEQHGDVPHTDMEAGTGDIQALLVVRDIMGISAFA